MARPENARDSYPEWDDEDLEPGWARKYIEDNYQEALQRLFKPY